MEATLHFQEMNELSPTVLERCFSLVLSFGAEREITARKISVHTQYKGHLTRSLKEEATGSGKAAIKRSAGVWSKGSISALLAGCHMETGLGAGRWGHRSFS